MKSSSFGALLPDLPWEPPLLPLRVQLALTRAEYLKRWTAVTDEMKARKK